MLDALRGATYAGHAITGRDPAPRNAHPGLGEMVVDAPAPLEIHLLGGFRVAVHGRAVPASAWRQRRAAAVIKLLALAPSHRLHREQLLEALWPDLDGEAAANNLRVAIHRARRPLEEAGAASGKFLIRDGEDVALATSDAIWVDVDAYAEAVAHAWLSEEPAAARPALDLFAGDLLPEDLYEDWAANRRAELRTSFLTLLARLAQLHQQRGELGRAIATLQRLLATEPLDEPAHAALIRLFALTGEVRQAVTQYERLAELLDNELGAEPEPSTRELIEAIGAGRFPAEKSPFAPAPPQQPRDAPPEPAPPELTGSLPRSLDPLIGRDREVAELRRLLATHRLVTLSGPAGVGKTRLALALAVARVATADRQETVRFVDLSPLREPELVLPAVARAFGIRDEDERPLLEAIATQLGAAPALLLLDNFEQVAAAAPVVAELLASCAGLTILVTSRGRLRLRGEQEYPVQPLAVPELMPPGKSSPPLAQSDLPAVTLFLRRAREADPGFTPVDADLEAAAEICRRLDGLPLAIELAAARVRILSPAALRDRLERPLTLLTGGPRDAPARQQTMRAAIAWSHDLLSLEEQALFRRLSAFFGGFTLDAAEAISHQLSAINSTEDGAIASTPRLLDSSTSSITHHPSPITLDLLSSLHEQSLLRRIDGENGATRFAMLETIREYALEQLEASGEESPVRARQAAFFLTLAERIEPELTGPAAADRFAELEREHDNLRAALATLSAQGETTAALRLAGALWRFWWLHGYLSEGRMRLERTLAEGAEAPAEIRAKAADGAGTLAAAQGDITTAATLHAEALRLWRETPPSSGDSSPWQGETPLPVGRGQGEGHREGVEGLGGVVPPSSGELGALINLGLIADEQGDSLRATSLFEEALLLARDLGDRRGTAVILANLGQVAMTVTDHERAAALLGESVALFRELGAQRDQAAILANLGLLALLIGDFPRARQAHEEALVLFRRLGDQQGEADELLNLGHAVQRLGDLERAATLFSDSLALFETLGDRSGAAFALTHLGWLAHLRGDEAEAESLLAQGLATAQDIDDRVAIAEALEGLAGVLSASGDANRAARLIGASEALREAIGVPLPDVHRADFQQCLTDSRQALGEQAFITARAEGHALMLAGASTPLALLAGNPAPIPSTNGYEPSSP